jgi:signal transduction histidine kinase
LLQPQGPGTVGLYIAVALAARAFPAPVSAALTVGCLGFVAATFFAGQDSWRLSHHPTGPGIVGVIAFAAVYAMSRFGRRIREQEAQEDRLVAELAESRGAELKAAALAERQRLAREMHDVLAHSLSGLAVQLEGTRLLAATTPDDPRLPAAIDRAHQLTKGGLDEARQAIGMLRGDDLPGPERIAALAAEFGADTGVPCRFATDGPPRELDPAVRLALYRITQEALTNVRKHARPDRVAVRLEYLPDAVRLTIEDSAAIPVPAGAGGDGMPAGDGMTGGGGVPAGPRVPAGGGYGLAGMRERAGLLGGRLTATPTPNGFRVLAEVPA